MLQSNPDSGITSSVYTFLVGLLTSCWSLTGYDATVHLLEETINADAAASWSMLTAIGASIVLGFIYILTLCICTPVRLSTRGCTMGPQQR